MPFGFQLLKSTTLSIRGAPDALLEAPLRIGPQFESNEELDLFLAAPPSQEMPLRIGSDVLNSGVATTYIDGVQGFGGTPREGDTTLYISPIENNGVSANTNIPLRMLGQATAPETQDATLYINPSDIPIGSGYLTTYVSGANPTNSNPVLQDSNSTLFIRNASAYNDEAVPSPTMPLHIETDFNLGETAPLYIKQTTPTKTSSLYIDGTVFASGVTSLYIRTPESDDITTYIIGFLE